MKLLLFTNSGDMHSPLLLPKRLLMQLAVTVCTVAILVSGNVSAQAPTELDEIRFSGDIHNRLPFDGGGNLVSDDDAIITFDLNTGTADSFAALIVPVGADVDGYHRGTDGCGQSIYSLDASAEIAGTVMRPGDVFQANGVKVINAAADGIPDGVNVDAITRDPATCDVVLSIDVHAELDGSSFDHDELIAWNATDGFSSFLSVDLGGADLDALHLLDNSALRGGSIGSIFFSTDVDWQIAGMTFRDEDVIEVVGGDDDSIELAFSPSLFNLSWEPTDIDALWVEQAVQGGEIQIVNAFREVQESTGTVFLQVERVNGSDGVAGIFLDSISGSATEDDDFSGDVTFTALWDDGESGIRNVPAVDIIDDNIQEPVEEFTIEISIFSGDATVGNPSSATIRILDNDGENLFSDGFES